MTGPDQHVVPHVGLLPAAGQFDPLGTPDLPSTHAGGARRGFAIDGVEVHRITPHVDPRGNLHETINFDVEFWREPVVYAYAITVNPGRIKGWGMHRSQVDRQVVLGGAVRFVLFDSRVDGPTHRCFEQVNFSTASPGILRIPAGVWHAVHNWGDEPVTVLNFPTVPYRHDDPDKCRIDPHSGEIPFDFAVVDG